MFSAALKSISSSNINANYSVSSSAVSTAGPWKIHDAKKKSTGQPYSVFVFDKKSLDSHGGSLNSSSSSRGGSTSMKRTVEEVVERLKKEASSLAKLRHPNILELVEPVEETRGGGLQFVTEPVTASLASLLREKDEQERHGGVGGRSSRYVTEDADGVRRRRELEIDELEIQKGLLQISKALEFLHDNAGLVHANLTPDGVLVNAKSDWKISGLAFCTPADGSTKPTSIQAISLSEVLNPDPRLPRFVQLDLDYTSPDFVLDTNLASASDMFSLGLLCIALYNSPHKSPIECHGSVSSYRRLFNASSTIPNPNNSFLSSRPLPRELATHVLPRLITRRPAQRMTAKEFQESEYFNNILVSSIRFLDAFPAKTPNEKKQFLRGLLRVLPEFPKSVMEKKLLPALLDEVKDKDLIALILQNVLKMVEILPSSRRAFTDKVRPCLKEIFITGAPKQPQEKDSAKDAGLMVVLENMTSCSGNCNGKEFKDDILPIVLTAIESPTHAVVDAALRGLPSVLPVLDFSTIKNELFPVIAAVFSRTNSLAIKVRGLQAFSILCGGSSTSSDEEDAAASDGLDGLQQPAQKKGSSSSALDKYTMQEKIVPLIKAVKTKEPAVMMAGLRVLRVVGKAADADFVAMDVLPVLWSMSLGPLLDLKQFRAFMDLIRALGQRVEEEQTRKLAELGGQGAATASAGARGVGNEDFLSFGGLSGTQFEEAGVGGNGADDDFESLVKGRLPPSKLGSSSSPLPAAVNPMDYNGDNNSANAVGGGFGANNNMVPGGGGAAAPAFSWSTTPGPRGPQPLSSSSSPSLAGLVAPTNKAVGGGGGGGRSTSARRGAAGFRTVTPDLAAFAPLAPSATQFSQPLQPTVSSSSGGGGGVSPRVSTSGGGAGVWGSTGSGPVSPSMQTQMAQTAPMGGLGGVRPGMSMGMGQSTVVSSPGAFSLPPPPRSSGGGLGGFSLAPPPSVTTPFNGASGMGMGMGAGGGMGMGLSGISINPTTSNPNVTSGMATGIKYGAGLGGTGLNMSSGGMGQQQQQQHAMGSMMRSASTGAGMGMGMGMSSVGSTMGQQQQQQQQHQQQQQVKQGGQVGQIGGLDKYESLL